MEVFVKSENVNYPLWIWAKVKNSGIFIFYLTYLTIIQSFNLIGSPIPWQQGSLGHNRWLRNQFPSFSSVLHCPRAGTWTTPHLCTPWCCLSISCLSCLLSPFTVPSKMVLDRPDEQDTCPYHFKFCLFMMIRRSLCGLIACWILTQTSSLVTWFLYEMLSILW